MRHLLVLLFSIFALTGAVHAADIALLPHVPDNATLSATKSTAYDYVVRDDFSAGLGAPPLTFKTSNSACSLNAGSGDGGSQVPSGDGKCWLAAFGAEGADFRAWGAASGTTVDVALDAAIAWACSSHLPLNVPYVGSGYLLAAAHKIGNGSSVSNSTCNAVTIIGSAIYPEFAAGNAELFQWTGAGGVIPITIQGPMLGVKMIGIGVDCRSICSTGIKADNILDSELGWLGVRGQIGPAFIMTSTPVNVWGGGFEGTWVHDLFAAFPGAGGSGGNIGDTTCNPCTAAVISSHFENLHWLYDGQTANTYGLKLGFVVQSTITGTRFLRVDNLGALGSSIIISPPPGALGYPDDVTIYHAIIQGPLVEGAGWVPASGLHLDSFPTTYQGFPVSSAYGKIWGTDATGNYYPSTSTWTPTDASGAALALTTSDTRWYKVGKVCTISARIVYPVTVSGATAQLAGVPSPCFPTAAAANATAGGAASYTTLGTPLNIVVDSTGHIGFYNLSSAYTNAGLSGKEIRVSLSWITD